MLVFTAAIRALGQPFAGLSIARLISERVYDFIARNRNRLGGNDFAVLPPELKARLFVG